MNEYTLHNEEIWLSLVTDTIGEPPALPTLQPHMKISKNKVTP
jgi:hypothetical protein